LFFTNISPPLSLWARSLWVTEVDEPHNRPPAMLGHGSAVRESILGHGSAARKICWVTEVQHEKYAGSRKCSTKNMLGHGRPPRLASAPLLSRQVPAGLLACCALPCPSLISIHTPP
jgi:hypothetical protein